MQKEDQHSELQLVNLAKAAAILAVVFLHALSLFPNSIYLSEHKYIAIFLNQASRFSVPLFLALSGFGLARKYANKPFDTKKFLTNRARKLLPLYFLWSLILLFSARAISGRSIFEAAFLGNADYHLYFVPVIFQLYLVFLILERIKNRKVIAIFTVALGVLQLLWFESIRYSLLPESLPVLGQLTDDQMQYRMITNWLFYFVLGFVIAQFNINRLRKIKFLKNLILLSVLTSLIWATVDSSRIILQTGNIVYATSFIRLPVMIYASTIILFVIIYGQDLLRFNWAKTKSLQYIGVLSYLIYLSHTYLLRIINELLLGEVRYTTLFFSLLLFFVATIFSKRLLRISPAISK